MEKKVFSTRSMLRMLLNVVLLMLAGYILEFASGWLGTGLNGMLRFTLLVLYMVSMIVNAVRYEHDTWKAAYEAEQFDHQAALAKIDEYDDALGSLMKANEALKIQMSVQSERLGKYEDSILGDRSEIARLKKSLKGMKQANSEAVEAMKQNSQAFEAYKSKTEALFKKQSEELEAYKQAERERQEKMSERGRKAAEAKHSKQEEEPISA